MADLTDDDPAPAERHLVCNALPARALRVVSGANLGDRLGLVEEPCPGDVYRLAPEVEMVELSVQDAMVARGPDGVARPGIGSSTEGHRLADAGGIAPRDAVLRLAARLTFLAPDGHSVDVMLASVAPPDEGQPPPEDALCLPLGPLEAGIDYTLVGLADAEPVPLAPVTVHGFASGTRITLADGRQVAVETLREGDRVLTRDRGPQPLIAMVRRTVRARGAHAPVVIAADLIGNPGELILSQRQRLLVYQRGEDRLTETAEMLVRAGHLVEGDQVSVRRGGFVEYYAPVLAQHDMLFAECVAAESLEVSDETLPGLPAEALAQVEGVKHARHWGTEAGRTVARAARARLFPRDK